LFFQTMFLACFLLSLKITSNFKVKYCMAMVIIVIPLSVLKIFLIELVVLWMNIAMKSKPFPPPPTKSWNFHLKCGDCFDWNTFSHSSICISIQSVYYECVLCIQCSSSHFITLFFAFCVLFVFVFCCVFQCLISTHHEAKVRRIHKHAKVSWKKNLDNAK
jgi:hypothetical protein